MSGFLENRFSDEDDELNIDSSYDDFDGEPDDELDDDVDFDDETDSEQSSGKIRRSRGHTEKVKTGNSQKKHGRASDGSSKNAERKRSRRGQRESGDINEDGSLNKNARGGSENNPEDFDQARRIISDKDDAMSEEEAEFLSDIENMMSEETKLKEEHRNAMIQRVFQIMIAVGCVYIIILIFGSLITEYHYGSNGTVEPVIMSVSDIEAKNEYNTLATLYLEERSLYERILILDYRVAENEEELMAIAPEYEEALDTVSTLATAIEAADLLSKYNQVATLMLTWVQTHLAAYCQYMSAAITQNDSSAAEEALAARNVVYSNFQLITENIITLGEEIKVYDLTDIKSWSPEEYVSETVGVQ